MDSPMPDRGFQFWVTWSNLQRQIPNQLHPKLDPTLAAVLDHLDQTLQKTSRKDRHLVMLRQALECRRLIICWTCSKSIESVT